MDIEWIRRGLMRPGKTQRGLAAAMNVDAAAVSRLLIGKRQLKASEIEPARRYLESDEEQKPMSNQVPRDQTASVALSPFVQSNVQGLEVLGMAEGGPDGWSLWNGELIQVIPRPANLLGVQGAYAVYISGTSMEPKFNPGDIAHIHPHKPITVGCYVLVQKRPNGPGEAPLAVIKQYVKRRGDRYVLAQHKPEKTFEIKLDEVVSIHRVVGSSEP